LASIYAFSSALAAPAAPPSAATAGSAAPEAAPGSGVTVLDAAMTCRALTVNGDATTSFGTALHPGASLDRTGWLDLTAGTSIAVKNATTAREVVLRGPAHVLPCDHGEERFLLSSGGIETSTWAGARPGAEVLVATPLGAIRYGDAKLEIAVDADSLSVAANIGEAWVLPAGAGAREEKVTTGKTLKKRGVHPDVKAIVVECEKRAADAETLARAVLVPGHGAAPLGVRASEHVRARQAARATCAIAAAAVVTAKTPAERDELGKRVSYADARWRSVPPLVDKAQKVESR
jgi:hypothetical protein